MEGLEYVIQQLEEAFEKRVSQTVMVSDEIISAALVELKKVNQLEEIRSRSHTFFNDVLPQIGGLCIQDLSNVNELGMSLDRLAPESES